MIERKRDRILNLIVFTMFFFSSMVLFKINGKTFFFCLSLLLVIYVILKDKKIYVYKNTYMRVSYVLLILTGLIAQSYSMPDSYKKTALVMPFLLLVYFFVAGIIEKEIKQNQEIIKVILKAIKFGCVFQFCYIPIQYLAYHIFGVDINNVIFVDTLGMTDNASFVRSWVWYPSGFAHHSAVITPLMIICFLLFDNIFFRILVLLDAFICGSSTAIVGIILTILLLLIVNLVNKKNNKLNKKNIIIFLIAIIAIIILIKRTEILQVINERLEYLMTRVMSDTNDASTNAHISYFMEYPDIFKKNTILENLFGYGYGCSGQIFSVKYGRENLGNWSVESEIMDCLYSRGIIGFLVFYYFLFDLMKKGNKINKKYVIIILVFIIQGFGYNIQWEYILLFEMFMYTSLDLNIDIFEIAKEV